jgi:hypothetical protein
MLIRRTTARHQDFNAALSASPKLDWALTAGALLRRWTNMACHRDYDAALKAGCQQPLDLQQSAGLISLNRLREALTVATNHWRSAIRATFANRGFVYCAWERRKRKDFGQLDPSKVLGRSVKQRLGDSAGAEGRCRGPRPRRQCRNRPSQQAYFLGRAPMRFLCFQLFVALCLPLTAAEAGRAALTTRVQSAADPTPHRALHGSSCSTGQTSGRDPMPSAPRPMRKRVNTMRRSTTMTRRCA